MQRATCPNEIDETKVLASLIIHPLRSQTLVVLGFESGLRISELCSLRIGDVYRNGACLSTLRVSRNRLKGGRSVRTRRYISSREIPLNERALEYLSRYLSDREKAGPLSPRAPLFPSRIKGRAVSRIQAWRLVRLVFLQAGLDPAKTWSGHSLRKRFCRRVFEISNLETARIASGHASALQLCAYLFMGQEASVEAVLAIGRIGNGGANAVVEKFPTPHDARNAAATPAAFPAAAIS